MDVKKLVGEWIVANWWLLLSGIIPSIIVGLTPKESKGKVMNVIKTVLEAVSFATHKDMPGTWKMPGKLSKKAPKKEEK